MRKGTRFDQFMAQWFAGRFTGRKETAAPHARAPLDENATAAQAAHNGGDLPEARPAAPQQPIILEVAPQPVAPEGRAPSAAPPPLPSINNYVLKQTLGVGAFGKVKLAEHKETGQLFAIKCIQKSRISAARQFERLQRHAPRDAPCAAPRGPRRLAPRARARPSSTRPYPPTACA